MTVSCVRFGYTRLRVPSRSSKDAKERMLASWRVDVLADPDHRDHRVLSGLAERITNRRHEVALMAMLEYKVATGMVVNNRSDAALYGALRRARTARGDRSLSVLGERLRRTWRACRARCASGPWRSCESTSATAGDGAQSDHPRTS